jgi:hypothetical protein
MALDPGDEHRLLGLEVMEEASGAGSQAGRPLDLRHRRRVVAPLAEQPHGLVEQALTGRICHGNHHLSVHLGPLSGW